MIAIPFAKFKEKNSFPPFPLGTYSFVVFLMHHLVYSACSDSSGKQQLDVVTMNHGCAVSCLSIQVGGCPMEREVLSSEKKIRLNSTQVCRAYS